MAAVRSDRIGIPVGLHRPRVLAWLRSSAGDALAGCRVWNLLKDDLAAHVGGTIQARPAVAAR